MPVMVLLAISSVMKFGVYSQGHLLRQIEQKHNRYLSCADEFQRRVSFALYRCSTNAKCDSFFVIKFKPHMRIKTNRSKVGNRSELTILESNIYIHRWCKSALKRSIKYAVPSFKVGEINSLVPVDHATNVVVISCAFTARTNYPSENQSIPISKPMPVAEYSAIVSRIIFKLIPYIKLLSER